MNPMPDIKWRQHLSLGITGHRQTNPALAANCDGVTKALESLFSQIDAMRIAMAGELAGVRLHSLLVDGVDQIAAKIALERKWDLIAPLPFGAQVNMAINALPTTPADAAALFADTPVSDKAVTARAANIRELVDQSRLFELADRDQQIRTLFEASLASPDDHETTRAFDALCSENVALAGRVMIERADLIIAVWDGKAINLPGGTGHTIVAALESGTPVLIMDPQLPENWSIHTRPEELGHLSQGGRVKADPLRLEATIKAAIALDSAHLSAIEKEKWRGTSSLLFSFYRRIEAVFGGADRPLASLQVQYEEPAKIEQGSGAHLIQTVQDALPRDDRVAQGVQGTLLPMFAWADGISSRLSDAYRSGMCFNFLLATLAVIVGVAYLPLGLGNQKWVFASAELLLLIGILAVTFAGHKFSWHRRWFETRRVAEYLRHAPSLLLIGVARPTGRWPRGSSVEWPEHFARHTLREVGLPQVRIDQDYLRNILKNVIGEHVSSQLSYHQQKAKRLETAHHRLDKAAEICFFLAIISVSAYLVLKLGAVAGVLPAEWPYATSKLFTFLGVAFPTLGANLAGVRYFGDFERFAAISRVTAEKLAEIDIRLNLLLTGSDDMLTYSAATEIARALDEAVIDEIENWQAVFGAKHLALPA